MNEISTNKKLNEKNIDIESFEKNIENNHNQRVKINITEESDDSDNENTNLKSNSKKNRKTEIRELIKSKRINKKNIINLELDENDDKVDEENDDELDEDDEEYDDQDDDEEDDDEEDDDEEDDEEDDNEEDNKDHDEEDDNEDNDNDSSKTNKDNYNESINECKETIHECKDTSNELKKNLLSQEPYVCTIENYLSDEECDHFINISRHRLERALVAGMKEGYVSTGRTGENCWIMHDNDEITSRVSKKISEIVGIPIQNAEAFQLIHYNETQEYQRHCDSWKFDGSEKMYRNMKYGGQRLTTALCYLNNVEEGGGTKFVKKNIYVEPKKGKLLIFKNVFNNTNICNPDSEHAGTPVIKGEKFAFNLWFREDSRKKLYDFGKINMSNLNCNHNENPFEKTIDETKNNNTTKDKSIVLNENKNTNLNVDSEFDIPTVRTKYISDIDIENIMSECILTENEKDNFWIKNNNIKISSLISRIEKEIGITKEFFENMNVIKYSKQYLHREHFNAYDMSTETGKKYTSIL